MTDIPNEEPEPNEWVAYCAPGMMLLAYINCMYFRPEHVTEVYESPVVEGSNIILVNRSKLYEGRK